MARRAKRSERGRLRLPDELEGPYSGILIGTYGAQLSFAERQLFRQLPRSAVNRVVLADRVQLARHLQHATDLRRVNRSYVAAPVRSPLAHHPKYLLMVGPEAGLLLVGSGNLSVDGYTGPGECFATYRWSVGATEDEPAFAAIRHLVDGLIAREWIDDIARSRIADLFKAAPWISTVELVTGPVRHNLDRPFLDQLAEQLGRRHVTELVAAAPFHDQGARALAQLLTRLQPDKFVLLVQEHQTRLDAPAVLRVTKKAGVAFELVEATAPSPYRPTLLHAKILLARTESADVLLQGSPNLSTVALTKSGDDANVELANLLEGPPGAFDAILDAIDRTRLVAGLASFEAAPFDESDEDDDLEPALADTVIWSSPRLEGQLLAPLPEGATFRVEASSMVLDPLAVVLATTSRGDVHFTLEFNATDAARIDASPQVRLHIQDIASAPIRPYHIQLLTRLSATGHRVDLLHEVGALDLNDAELEQLLVELDRVLIVDGRSLWRLAHPDQPPVPDDAAVLPINYDDLDWERIGEHAGYAIGTTDGAIHGLAPTELGLVLQSLTERFRVEVRRGLGLGDDPIDDEPDDLENEQASEDEEALEETDEAESDEHGPRRLTAKARVRLLWRNFIRRFVRGLSDAEFVNGVGSSVIIPSYIVFNQLCRRLRAVDLVDPDYLTDAQCALWSFVWGVRDGPAGYLDRLPADERAAAIGLLDRHDHLPSFLAAIDDAFWYAEGSAPERLVRDALRGFLESDSWVAQPTALQEAAAAAINLGGSTDQLADDLDELAEIAYASELANEIAAQLEISADELEETDADVNIGHVEFYVVTNADYVLSPWHAAWALGVWAALEPGRTYFRLAAKNGVAIVNAELGQHFFYDHITGEEQELNPDAPQEPRWRERLAELVEVAA